MTLRLLVTGGTGFVGRALATAAVERGAMVRVTSRRPAAQGGGAAAHCIVPSLDAGTDWRAALADIEVVIHCAARVHVMKETARAPLASFREANLDGTMRLARAAASAGVRRFVYISSIGVNGAATHGLPFSAASVPAPHSPYAQSKYEAELALAAFARQCGMELVIVRPPLVYGPAAPGNFGALVRAVQRGSWLPLGAVHNRRSFVGQDNLADFLLRCAVDARAAGHTFLVSDDADVSTTQLLQKLAHAAGRPSRLLAVPVPLLRLVGMALGKSAALQSVTGNLQVDVGAARDQLGWRPPLSLDEGLRRIFAAPRR
jgi:nucleoside-diphosphate-sugar epimerase